MVDHDFVLPLLQDCFAGSCRLFIIFFKPPFVLKGNLKAGKEVPTTKILVVIQFSSSVVLMIGTVIVYQQIQYGKNLPIGFNNKGLISVYWSDDIANHIDALRQELIKVQVQPLQYVKAIPSPSELQSNNNGWEWKEASLLKNGYIFNNNHHL